MMAPSDEQPAASTIETNLRCIGCGYDLVGLLKNGICPECGAPVAHTTRMLLAHSNPAHIRTLRNGAVMVLNGAVGFILIGCVFVYGTFSSHAHVNSNPIPLFGLYFLLAVLGSLAFLVVFAMGWWRISAPDLGHAAPAKHETARRLTRLGAVFTVVIAVLCLASYCLSGFMTAGSSTLNSSAAAILVVPIALWLLAYTVGVLLFSVSCWFISWVGRRIPDSRIVKRAKLLTWLGPLLLTIGTFLFYLGPLIALLLLIRLLVRVRCDLDKILQKQASPAA